MAKKLIKATVENMRRLAGTPGLVMVSPRSGETYSAAAGDYFWAPPGHVFKDSRGRVMYLGSQVPQHARPILENPRYEAGKWPAYNVKYIVSNIEKVFRTRNIKNLSKGPYTFISLHMGFIAHYNLYGFQAAYGDLEEFARRLQTSEYSDDYDYNLRWANTLETERMREGPEYGKSRANAIRAIVAVARKYYPSRGTQSMFNPAGGVFEKFIKSKNWSIQMLADDIILPWMMNYPGDKLSFKEIAEYVRKQKVGIWPLSKLTDRHIQRALLYLQQGGEILSLKPTKYTKGGYVALRGGEGYIPGFGHMKSNPRDREQLRQFGGTLFLRCATVSTSEEAQEIKRDWESRGAEVRLSRSGKNWVVWTHRPSAPLSSAPLLKYDVYWKQSVAFAGYGMGARGHYTAMAPSAAEAVREARMNASLGVVIIGARRVQRGINIERE